VVHPWHLSGLTPNQSAPGLETTLGDPGNDVGSDRNVQLGARKVIQKVEGFGTLNDEIVDGHGDEIDPDARMDSAIESDPQLGPHSVRPTDQDGIPEPGGFEIERASEPSNLTIRTRSSSRLDDGFDGVYESVPVVDRDTSGGISQRFRVGRDVLTERAVRSNTMITISPESSFMARDDAVQTRRPRAILTGERYPS
jgi:hypothetical protein